MIDITIQISTNKYIEKDEINKFFKNLFNLNDNEIGADTDFVQYFNTVNDFKIGYEIRYSNQNKTTNFDIFLICSQIYDWSELVLSFYMAYEFNCQVLTSASGIKHALLLLICPNGQVHRLLDVETDCEDFDSLSGSSTHSEFYLDLIKEYYPDFEDEEDFINSVSLYQKGSNDL